MTAPAPLAFLSGAPGPGELVVLFLVVLVLFGPKRLPHIARMIGKALNDLRRASQDFRDQVMQIDDEPPVDVPYREADVTDTAADATSPEQREEPAEETGTPGDDPVGRDTAPGH